jgi:hypothetical protein
MIVIDCPLLSIIAYSSQWDVTNKEVLCFVFSSGKSIIRRYRVDQQDWYLLFIPKLFIHVLFSCYVMWNSEVIFIVPQAVRIHDMFPVSVYLRGKF